MRERPDDIPVLAAYLLANMEETRNRGSVCFDPMVLEMFCFYKWPGNVRELRNVLTFALFSLEDGCRTIAPRHLPPHLIEECLHQAPLRHDKKSGAELLEETSLSLSDKRLLEAVTDRVARETIFNVLAKCKGNKSLTAKELGISRTWLYKKLKSFNFVTGG
jgi:DNA-binding NtrC family response regulator